MTELAWLGLAAGLATVAFVGVKAWHRRRTGAELDAARVVRVWSRLGPFRSGEHSASAMYLSARSVLGDRAADLLLDSLCDHAELFDRDPESWTRVLREGSEIRDRGAERVAARLRPRLAARLARVDDDPGRLWFGLLLEVAESSTA